ncbi:MAG TPA: ATP-dependent DNA ligase [Rugosimonospora sp.]|nr:ATP-dependent DNA ligase [Rugosimonospora sp.]
MQPVQPMLAAPVEELPEGPGWAYEPKFDGWRAIATHRGAEVRLHSRAGRSLADYFPDVTQAVREYLPVGTVVDGELIVWNRERTDFTLLQRRITVGAGLPRMVHEHPAHYVLFDLLAVAGEDLTGLPLAARRARLTQLLSANPVQLPLCPQTTDLVQARTWLAELGAAGVEGVVAKRLDGRYLPGQRGWRKLRVRTGTEAVIGGVTGSIRNPATLLLGRLDAAGRLRYVGRTGPVPAGHRAELATLLTAGGRGGGEHPWPQPLPARWSGSLRHRSRCLTSRSSRSRWSRSRSTPPMNMAAGAIRPSTCVSGRTCRSRTSRHTCLNGSTRAARWTSEPARE